MFSRPDAQRTTDRFLSGPPDGRQPEAAQGAVKPRSGAIAEDDATKEKSR